MSTFVKKPVIPESVVEEGTAKRNILRKGGVSKGGIGRKETAAGKLVDDGSLYEDSSALDVHDPNYDSEEETGKKYIPKLSGLHRDEIDIIKPKVSISTYKKRVEPIIMEYFVSGDVADTASSIQELDAPQYAFEFVKRIISMSMDKDDRERESVSRLLTQLHPDILSSSTIEKGLERLFEIIDEIEKDAPAARSIMAAYIARGVVDEVIPPSYLSDSVACDLGGDMIERAKLLLSRDHGGAKLEKIWGPGDGRPVEEMKVAVDQLLQEYLLSGDMEEAIRCICELHAPLFAHEVVKRAVINSLDKSAEKQLQMSKLLANLAKNEIVSVVQAEKAFQRLEAALPDLTLDTPSAKKVVEEFQQRAIADGVLPAKP